jgi:hypothetical protein
MIQFPAREEVSLQSVPTDPGTHPAPYAVGVGALSRREANTSI